MKNIITIALLAWAITAQAQSDSSQLAIFNTGRNITVLSADFGAAMTADLIGEMVMAYDTVMVLKADNKADSSGRKPMRYQSERRATKISSNLKDKIAVIDYEKSFDVTEMAMNVQKAGAKALIIIHESNDKKVYKLKKNGTYKDSIRIPVYTIANDKGAAIQQLLPSMVGIKSPTDMPTNASVAANATPPVATAEKSKDKMNNADATFNADLSNSTSFGKQGFTVSPNPTRNQANVTYQFQNPTDVTIEAKTASGQVIFTRILRGAIVGNVEIPTVDYPNGTYFVTLQYGKEVKTKKLVVRH